MKKRWTALGVVALLAAHLAPLHAAEPVGFPDKPVRWIVPYASGGPTDQIARITAAALTGTWKQQIVIDPRPGANSIIGTAIAAQAAADGYTMLLALPALTINPWIRRDLPYDALRDLVPVTRIAAAGYVVLLHPGVGADSLAGFLDSARRQPGKFSFGSGGVGSPAQLAMTLLAESAGVRMVHVPYKGGAPALTDLIAGRIQAMVNPPVSSLPHVRAGRLRAVAVTSAARMNLLPDVPTVAEALGEPYDVSTWYGLFVPAATPSRIVAQVHRDVVAVLRDPAVGDHLQALGAAPVGEAPREFADFIRSEMTKWRAMVRAAGIEPK